MDRENITTSYETGKSDALLGRPYCPTGGGYSNGFNDGVALIEERGALERVAIAAEQLRDVMCDLVPDEVAEALGFDGRDHRFLDALAQRARDLVREEEVARHWEAGLPDGAGS